MRALSFHFLVASVLGMLGTTNPFLPMCSVERPGPGPGPVEAGFFGGFRVNGELLPLAPINVMVVLAYAPWCPFSQQLMPIFGNVSMAFPDLSFLLVNADREWRLASRYMLRGFPVILVFRNGKLTDHFDGERTVEGLYEFFESLSGETPAKLVSELTVVVPELQEEVTWLLLFSYAVTVAMGIFQCVQLWIWYSSRASRPRQKEPKQPPTAIRGTSAGKLFAEDQNVEPPSMEEPSATSQLTIEGISGESLREEHFSMERFMEASREEPRADSKEEPHVSREEPREEPLREEPRMEPSREEPRVEASKEVEASREEPLVEPSREEPRVEASRGEPSREAFSMEPFVEAPMEEPSGETFGKLSLEGPLKETELPEGWRNDPLAESPIEGSMRTPAFDEVNVTSTTTPFETPQTATPHTTQDTPHTSQDTPHISQDTPHTSQNTPHIPKDTPHISQDTPYISQDTHFPSRDTMQQHNTPSNFSQDTHEHNTPQQNDTPQPEQDIPQRRDTPQHTADHIPHLQQETPQSIPQNTPQHTLQQETPQGTPQDVAQEAAQNNAHDTPLMSPLHGDTPPTPPHTDASRDLSEDPEGTVWL